MGTYKIIGVDGRTYGPVALEQLKQWIAEGRANTRTQTLAEGAAEWKPLGTLPEFAGCFAPPVPPMMSPLSAGSIPKTNSFAIAGMVFGLLAILCCCKFLFGTLGVVFSLIGLSQINRHPELYEGRGLALAGLVLSVLSFLMAFLFILIALASGQFHYSWYFHHS